MKKGKDFRMPAIACALIIVMCIGFVVSYGLLGNSILGNLHTAQAAENVLTEAAETEMATEAAETLTAGAERIASDTAAEIADNGTATGNNR
ncbi:hypothetical protein [Aristaeella lactis]|uniref:Uncharacterized protein n=1 Tax=Aristaeella lactis TaxID=3046383 RepID=A0AC61PKK2_9FIRM|nr:hypothetical protein [Aristaeella lactis]QUA52005.1 hypothetical protein JYE50_09780 [Aristaeella lactis]SMC54808.1 hypothetical protein SAMN06297397_1378 [Aristaeella lactis]